MNPLPSIVVSRTNPHLLETSDGSPFLMLGDTAWELFHRLTLEEIDMYFGVRARQGFNMIWANLLAEFDGLKTPNRYGHLPLIDLEPESPNEAYFEFVDQVLLLAEKHGLYMGLLPTWGDKLTAPWGAGPTIFGLDNLPKSCAYARWLGHRYANFTNIMWVLGGDRPTRLFGADNEFPMRNGLEAGLERTTDWTPIWREMASGLKESGAHQLMTYHPQGGTRSTSSFLHQEDWLDLNAMQSGHGGGHDVPVWESIDRDYQLLPIKPTFDAEPNYEDHPVSPWPVWDPANGFFDDLDIRKQIYRSIFAGGCGVIYGNHCVWQFASELFEPVLEVKFDWKSALVQPGAESMAHLALLMNSVDFLGLRPDQTLILGDHSAGPSHARAIRSDQEALVYVPDSRIIEIDLSWSNDSIVQIQEFNPVNGTIHQLESIQDEKKTAFCSPISTDRDRVIILRVR